MVHITNVPASAEEPSTLTALEKLQIRMLELGATNLARKERTIELESMLPANSTGRSRLNSDDDHYGDKAGTRKKKKASRPKTPPIESARTFEQLQNWLLRYEDYICGYEDEFDNKKEKFTRSSTVLS